MAVLATSASMVRAAPSWAARSSPIWDRSAVAAPARASSTGSAMASSQLVGMIRRRHTTPSRQKASTSSSVTARTGRRGSSGSTTGVWQAEAGRLGPRVPGAVAEALSTRRLLGASTLHPDLGGPHDELGHDADEHEVQQHLEGDHESGPAVDGTDVTEADGGEHGDDEVEAVDPVDRLGEPARVVVGHPDVGVGEDDDEQRDDRGDGFDPSQRRVVVDDDPLHLADGHDDEQGDPSEEHDQPQGGGVVSTGMRK